MLLVVIGHIEPLLTLAVSYAGKVFFLPKEEEQRGFSLLKEPDYVPRKKLKQIQKL